MTTSNSRAADREAGGKVAEESLDEWTTPRPTLARAGDESLSAGRTLHSREVDPLNLSGRDAMPTFRAHRVQTTSHFIKVDLLLSWHASSRADLGSRAGE
jgi:hypothetical protein